MVWGGFALIIGIPLLVIIGWGIFEILGFLVAHIKFILIIGIMIPFVILIHGIWSEIKFRRGQ